MMAKRKSGDSSFYKAQGQTEGPDYGMDTNPKSTAKSNQPAKDLLP